MTKVIKPVAWVSKATLDSIEAKKRTGASHVSVSLRVDRFDDYYNIPLYEARGNNGIEHYQFVLGQVGGTLLEMKECEDCIKIATKGDLYCTKHAIILGGWLGAYMYPEDDDD